MKKIIKLHPDMRGRVLGFIMLTAPGAGWWVAIVPRGKSRPRRRGGMWVLCDSPPVPWCHDGPMRPWDRFAPERCEHFYTRQHCSTARCL